MKKSISLLLVLIMCLSLCACGGDNEPSDVETTSQNNESIVADNNHESNPSGSTDENIDFEKMLLNNGVFWGYTNRLDNTAFNEDGTTIFPDGTWTLEGNIVKITLEDGHTDIYKITELNGIFYLVGDRDTMYSDVQIGYDEIPSKSVEITLDNWQEYFELYCESEEIYDQFGESTGEINEYYLLRLKDEYSRIYLADDSEVLLRFTQNGTEQDAQINGYDNRLIYIQNFMNYPLEMVKIQGSLYFVDGL